MHYVINSIFFVVFAAVLWIQPVIAQEIKKEQAPRETLYARGLHACLEKEIQAYSKFSQRDLHKVSVSYDLYVTKDLPEQFGDIKLHSLNDWQLAEKYKALSKTGRERVIPVMKIFPIYDKEDKLRFAYNNYWFTYAEAGGVSTRRKFEFDWA